MLCDIHLDKDFSEWQLFMDFFLQSDSWDSEELICDQLVLFHLLIIMTFLINIDGKIPFKTCVQ